MKTIVHGQNEMLEQFKKFEGKTYKENQLQLDKQTMFNQLLNQAKQDNSSIEREKNSVLEADSTMKKIQQNVERIRQYFVIINETVKFLRENQVPIDFTKDQSEAEIFLT